MWYEIQDWPRRRCISIEADSVDEAKEQARNAKTNEWDWYDCDYNADDPAYLIYCGNEIDECDELVESVDKL